MCLKRRLLFGPSACFSSHERVSLMPPSSSPLAALGLYLISPAVACLGPHPRDCGVSAPGGQGCISCLNEPAIATSLKTVFSLDSWPLPEANPHCVQLSLYETSQKVSRSSDLPALRPFCNHGDLCLTADLLSLSTRPLCLPGLNSP